jgi:transposase
MKRFIEGQDRSQVTLLPECLDDYLGEDNPVRVVDAFVDELSLEELGFEGAQPAATGRPSYHPAVLLKIYIYGYLNQIQSSRRLEREAQRNIELMWLTGRLAPDFKTIADFRKDHGAAIRNVCREFVLLCRRLKLFADGVVAIVGYNVQAAVDAKHHMIVAHEVTNSVTDQGQLPAMAKATKEAIGHPKPTVLADRGYFEGYDILECEQAGIETLVPKPLTSNSKFHGRFDKRDFIYDPSRDVYRCPAGQIAIHRYTTVEAGKTQRRYWTSACPSCHLKP